MSARNQLSLIVLLIVIFLSIKLTLLFMPHHVGWDEAVYLGMGKYLYSGGEAGLWEDIRPPGLPLILGMLWVISPSNLIVLSELLSIIFGVACGVLTFLLGRKLFSWQTGAFSALLLLSAPVFFLSSSAIMSAVPATFFSLLALYLFVCKKHPIVVGISVGIAFLFRFTHGTMLVALIVLYMVSPRKFRNLSLVVGGSLIAVLPFLVFNYVQYSDITASPIDALFRPFIFASSHQYNPFHQESVFFYLVQLLRENALFAVGVIVIFFFRSRLSIVVPFLLYLLYYSIIPNKQARFLVDFLPVICIITAAGISRASAFLRTKRLIVLTFFVLIAVAFIPAFYHNYLDYAQRPVFESPLVPFFENVSSFGGPFLTMTPLPAVYGDSLFIPMYEDPAVALETYHTWKDKVNYVLYFSDYYPCTDAVCADQQAALYTELEKHQRVMEFEVHNQNYTLFRIT